jgi:hypothetical protein
MTATETTPIPNKPRPLEVGCEWTAADVADPRAWTELLTADECDELDRAMRHAFSVSDDPLDIAREDFPLGSLVDRLASIEHELINGRGFVRLRGIDRDRYDQSEMEMLYWGIGTHLGTPWAQNKHGHVLGDVIDQGRSFDDPEARGNELGGVALPFHCDGSDLVGLMCLRNGVSGGESLVANSVTIHNRLVRETPELAAELYSPQPYHFRGEQPPGENPWYAVPVFTDFDDRLFVRCIPPYITASQAIPEAPRLTELATAALDRLVDLANDPENHVAMELLPGDMQFINNYHVMHGRMAYEDDPGTNAVRHLKRLWLETSSLTQRPEVFRNGSNSHWAKRRSASKIVTDGSTPE